MSVPKKSALSKSSLYITEVVNRQEKAHNFYLKKNIYINQCVRNLDPLLCVASLYKLNISRSCLTGHPVCITEILFPFIGYTLYILIQQLY